MSSSKDGLLNLYKNLQNKVWDDKTLSKKQQEL